MKGWKIRLLRNHLKLTQVELADKLGVDFSTVNRWENDRGRPSNLASKGLRSIAKKSGLDFDYYMNLKHKIRLREEKKKKSD